MAIELKDIEEVAKDLSAKFDEFKQTNDKRVEAVEQEKASLSGKVDNLNEKLTELEGIKKQLETLQKQQNRPGISDAATQEYKEGFMKFIRKGDESILATKALNTGTDADGGFAVPEELDRQILELERDMSPMRQVCNQISVSTPDYKKLVNLGGAGSGWVGETAERPETGTPTLAQITATMGEIYANPATTQTALDDVFFDAEGWLSSEVAYTFNEQEGNAYLLGNGTNKPIGLLAGTINTSDDSARAFGALQRIVAGSPTAVTGDELISLVYALKQGYRNGSSWMMNTLSVGNVRKLKTTDNQYLWAPGLQAGQPSTLLGYTVVENEDMANMEANANSIIFGNFARAYTIVDRIGTRVIRDPFTNKPYVHFYTTRRTGGMLTDSNSVKVLTQAAA